MLQNQQIQWKVSLMVLFESILREVKIKCYRIPREKNNFPEGGIHSFTHSVMCPLIACLNTGPVCLLISQIKKHIIPHRAHPEDIVQ